MEKQTSKSIVLGAILLFAGMLLLSSNFNLLPWAVHHLIFSWRTLLIVIGLFIVLTSDNRVPGVILIGIGGFFLLPQLMGLHFGFREVFLPFFFIFLGVVILFSRSHRCKRPVEGAGTYFCRPDEGSRDHYLDEVAIFGGGDRQVTSQAFRGGKIVAIFGGSTLSFMQSRLAPGVQSLDMLLVFGGTKLIVPADWKVRTEIISVFGGFSDKRINIQSATGPEAGELVIKGIALFGGGEIKSY